MALTDEQYQQVFRYVDEDMHADESAAFELEMTDNKELAEETEMYKQVKALSESVEAKLPQSPRSVLEEKQSHDEILALLNETRKKWEQRYEQDLKLESGIDANTDKKIHSIAQKPVVGKMRFPKWVAIAVVAGLVSASIGLRFILKKTDDSKIIVNAGGDSVTLSDTKEVRKSVTGQIPDTTLPKQSGTQEYLSNELTKPNKLFEENFIPDEAPVYREGPLENALNYYDNKMYEEAAREFESADLGPLTRGLDDENQQLTAFYSHYYKALSYLAADLNTSKAISELKKSISKNPGNASKTKAMWYLALAYLKNGNIQAAINYLEQISRSAPANELKQRAVHLRNRLRK